MMRLLPYPLASAGLFLLWLTLNQSVSPGQILLGALAALLGGWTLSALAAPRRRIGRPAAVLHLAARVVTDIVRSNLAVARIILGLGNREPTSGFVDIPIGLRDPYGLAVLACIITSTPGTLWVAFDPEAGMLTIHILDLVDEDDWIRTIKHRYELPLLEIFA